MTAGEGCIASWKPAVPGTGSTPQRVTSQVFNEMCHAGAGPRICVAPYRAAIGVRALRCAGAVPLLAFSTVH